MNELPVDIICGGVESPKDCCIKLDDISCDGYNKNMAIGVFSHYHSDHIKYLRQCITKYDILITHNITFESINALEPGMRSREQWTPQDYDTKYTFGDDGVIRLLKANHIPGSSQVHVEADGNTMLYSGDFNYPGMQIRKAEYLVLDSTHGDSTYDGKTDRQYVKKKIFEYIEEKIEKNYQIVIQVTTGTLQEIIRHFEIGYGKKMCDDINFVMDVKQNKILHNMYKDEKKEFRKFVEYDSPEFWNKVNTNKKCVIFLTQLNILDESVRQFHKIMIDRYKFTKKEEPIIPFTGGCRFNLAAHASITDIYKYVDEVDPKYVITDNSRGSYGMNLARLIEQKFPRIKTSFRPSN